MKTEKKETLIFTTCERADVPKVLHRRMYALIKGVRAFYDTQADACEVFGADDYKSTASFVNALSVAIKSEGLKHDLKAVQRRGRVFIIRK